MCTSVEGFENDTMLQIGGGEYMCDATAVVNLGTIEENQDEDKFTDIKCEN